MSDHHLHHEGHEHPDQDWQGGPSHDSAYDHAWSNGLPEEREQAYRELMLEEERQKKLAKLGERILSILRAGKFNQWTYDETCELVYKAADSLGLCVEDCEPNKPDHASQERASFERETLERYMGGE